MASSSAGIGPSESYSNIQSSEVDVEVLSMLWEGQQVRECEGVVEAAQTDGSKIVVVRGSNRGGQKVVEHDSKNATLRVVNGEVGRVE